MKKIFPFVFLAMLLGGLLWFGTSCHLIFPFESVSIEVVKPYLCSAQIYREIAGSSQEFTEEWEYYAWVDLDYGYCEQGDPDKLGKECTSNGQCGSAGKCTTNGQIDNADAIKYCTKKIDEYISEYMAPGFTWSHRNLAALQVTKNQARDCQDPLVLPPLTYGAPLGAELRWNFPPETQGYLYVSLTDKDGTTRVAEPKVANAYLDFAERTGLPDLSSGGIYVPETRHIRIADLFMEVNTPFQLGDDLKITKLYIQSIGSVIAEYTGGNGYRIYPGKGKFFFYATGEKSGEGGATSFCFNNSINGNIEEYQGPPYSFFAFSITLTPEVLGQDMLVKISLSKPTSDPSEFKTHQPFLVLQDEETTDAEVDLEPLTAFDHDNDLDLTKFLWFEDFETPDEIFLGEGQKLTNVAFSRGEHKVTLVAYDEKGSYNSATMTVKVTNAAPVAKDDAYDVKEDTALYVAPRGVLSNDTDANSDTLTAVLVSNPANGKLTLQPDGSFTYASTPNFFGTDSFTYKANDGKDDSNTATVTIAVDEVPPQAESENLKDVVNNLVLSGSLNSGQANSLKSKLNTVIQKLNSGNVQAACNVLQAFINEVKSLITDGVLSAAEGQVLIDKAQNIRLELNC